ncbi:MAG: 7-cyano-7-deazaguanine synthase QueC [Burkholderiaceae bacterium]
MKPAVVLLSGGLDSSTCLALAKSQGYDCHALSFDYGQRQRQELMAAKTVAQTIGVASHRILNLDMRAIGGSALTSDMAVPKHRSAEEIGQGIPVTYVPARNTIFLSYALGLAEVLKANDIFIGVNALDYSGYPDCRPAFIKAFQTMANLATAAGVSGQSPMTIHTPLIDMTKAQIVRTALDLGLDIDTTFSCYDPTPAGEPCGACDACLLRAKGISEAQST